MLNGNNNIVLTNINNSNPKESFFLSLIHHSNQTFYRYNPVPLSTISQSFNNKILSAIISLLVFTINTLCSTFLINFYLILFKFYSQLLFIVHRLSQFDKNLISHVNVDSFLLSNSLKDFPVFTSSDSNTTISFTDTNISVASVFPRIFQTKVKEEEILIMSTILFNPFLPFDIYKPEHEEDITIEHKEETLIRNSYIQMDAFLPSVFLATSPSPISHSIFIKPCSNADTILTSSSKPSPSSVMSSSDRILTSFSKSSQTSSPLLFPRSKKRSVLRRTQSIIHNTPNEQLNTDQDKKLYKNEIKSDMINNTCIMIFYNLTYSILSILLVL